MNTLSPHAISLSHQGGNSEPRCLLALTKDILVRWQCVTLNEPCVALTVAGQKGQYQAGQRRRFYKWSHLDYNLEVIQVRTEQRDLKHCRYVA